MRPKIRIDLNTDEYEGGEELADELADELTDELANELDEGIVI